MSDVSIDLGLNAKEVYTELAAVQQRVSQAMDRIGGSTGKVASGGEHLLASNHRVARQIQNFSKDLLSGASAADVFSNGLEGLERSLHLPLGALAGIGISAVAIAKISEAYSEYRKLNAEVDRLSAPHPDAQFRSLSQIEEQATETTKTLETLRDKQGSLIQQVKEFFALNAIEGIRRAFTDPARAPFRGANIRKERAKQIDNLENDVAAQNQTDLVSKARANTGIAKTHANVGDFAADRLKINQEFDEKFDQTVKKQGARGIVELEKQRAIALSEIARKEAAQLRSIALEQKVTQIKKEGADVEKRSALAMVEAAQKELSFAKPEDKPAALSKLDAAKEELALARQSTEERKKQSQLQVAIAQLSGAGAARHLAELRLEENTLRDRLRSATPDKAAGINDDLDKNKSRQHEIVADARRNYSDSLGERAKLSLEDIAQNGRSGRGKAIEALREEQFARRDALSGNLRGAVEHQSRADQVRESIGTLKDSDKPLHQLREALDASIVLKNIEKNTAGIGTNK